MKEKRSKSNTAASNTMGGMKIDGTDIGAVRIHENVIASIVRKATCSTNGVMRLSGSALVDNLAEIIGNRRIHDRAINVHIDGDAVSIDVKINIHYGVHVPTVASHVQSNVVEEVERITGMTVSNVNVIIQELEDEEDDSAESL